MNRPCLRRSPAPFLSSAVLLTVLACQGAPPPVASDQGATGPQSNDSGVSSPEASVGTDASNPQDGGHPGDATMETQVDAAECAPPFNCVDSALPDVTPPFDEDALTHGPDGTTSTGYCDDSTYAFATEQMVATGPTPAFVSAYQAAIAAAPTGGFVFILNNANVASATAWSSTLAGAQGLDDSTAQLTETGATYPLSFGDTGSNLQLTIAQTFSSFHLAFTTNDDPAGDIVVAGFQLSATVQTDSGCGQLEEVTATLYIAQSQASAPLGSSTLGQLLGATNATVEGGPGWAIPLSGQAQEINTQ